MDNLLNPKLCSDLRDVINETDIFIKDVEESEKYNLTCALMDRFDTAVEYINKHLLLPNNEGEFVAFINFVCNIKDGINYMCKVLNIPLNEDKKIFEETYRKYPIDLPLEKEYSDDRFFEYFRSLVFAHPFLTDRSIPNPIRGEIQYSPFIIIGGIYASKEIKSPVGVMIYSNKREEVFSVVISFEKLKEYIKFKYEHLAKITEAFRNIIEKKQVEWKKRKVNRSLNDIGILKDIKNILEERCIDSFEINELILYLNCKSTKQENEESVNKYKEAIKNIIPRICDAVDKFDYEEIYNLCGIVLNSRPKGHPMMHYQLEKIFGYLNDDYGDVKWGLKQAELFSKEFAKKWVVIEPYNMNFDEIKMLTNVACYLEYKEQKEVKISE